MGCKTGEISRDIGAWLRLVHPEDTKILASAVELHRTSTEPTYYEYRVRHRSDAYRYWSDHALPLIDDAGRPYKWIGACKNINTEKKHQDQLEYIAHYDTLTDLPNRALLVDRLRQAMLQGKRRDKQLAIVYLDLDGFKTINDTYGHGAGDRFLAALGIRLKQALREGDTIARLGGDKFVAVLIDICDIDDYVTLLKRLLQVAAQPVHLDDLVLQVSASLGVTFYPQAEEVDADLLLRQSDQAMYQAKLAGRNRYHIFDTDHDRSVRGRHESLERIREALAERKFLLYYQPKVSMRTGEVIGAEALIRWRHPEQGLLSPINFLPVIEDQPLAVELGEWIIDTALSQIQAWQAHGLDIPVSVNIGARQLQHPDFVQRLGELLAAYPDIKRDCLELEVLETSALEDMFQVSQVMHACKKIGVSFAHRPNHTYWKALHNHSFS
ncbi:MAG: diguanylate cyclase [Gammaproteobacteria bacterium]|nr:diguanylate cyclase [Gammaproteobacteria bacterium]